MAIQQIFKHVPTIKGILLFYAIILVDLAMLLSRKQPFQDPLLSEASTHISNFALSSMMVALMSFIMTLQAGPFKLTIRLGLIFIALNFFVEVFIQILNTPDLIDALYGTAGVILTTAIMYVFYQIGIRKDSPPTAEISRQK